MLLNVPPPLDDARTGRVIDLLNTVHEGGTTLLVITHNPRLVKFGRVVDMDQLKRDGAARSSGNAWRRPKCE